MRRLVAVGRKYPDYSTQHVTIDFFAPGWKPQRDPKAPEVDDDDRRKRALEEPRDDL